MVVSCLELTNKGLGRRKMLGLVVVKMKVGRSKENLEGVYGKVDEC